MIRNINLKIVGIYIGMFVLLIVAQVVMLITGVVNLANDAEVIRFKSLTNLTFYGLMVVLYVALFIPFWKDEFKKLKGNIGKYFLTFIVGFVVIFGASLIIGAIYQALGITDTSANQEQLDLIANAELIDQISLALFAVLFAPLVEELVFRKAFFGFFSINKANRWIIIVASALIFGFIHVAATFDFVQIFYYAGLGLVLAFFYYKTDNIIVPIVIHMLHNGFVTAIMFSGV